MLSNNDRKRIIELLEGGQELPVDYKNLLFPPERKEYELVYARKEREEDIVADTMAVPLQPIKAFGKSEDEWTNKLIFGDNLQVLKALLDNPEVKGRVKLIYIDPPFATKKEFRGTQDQKAYQDKVAGAEFIEFLRKRLILLRDILANDGSIFVHLDTKKSHYMKVVLDEIFGESNFRNEIIWRRQSAHNDSKQCGAIHETIFFYSKSNKWVWNEILTEPSPDYLEQFFDQVEPETGRRYARGDLSAGGLTGGGYNYEFKGIKHIWRCPITTMERYEAEGRLHWPKKGVPRLKRYLDEFEGVSIQDIWSDIRVIHNRSPERVGYPTQKPESLLERIISATSNSGDIVLDAFAGSGTTLAVSEKLGRKWIGIDCGKLALYTIQKRMLNLKEKIGEKGKPLEASPFTLYNAGLYDFSKLKKLPWKEWRLFAIYLFNCRDEKHRVSGIEIDGYKGKSDVLVFNYQQEDGVVLDYGYIDDLNSMFGSKAGTKFFIIAPAASVLFLEDYIDRGSTRYYILRIPYSIINELHNRDFEAIRQPINESEVNETVDAVGFDFIRAPKVECDYYLEKAKGPAVISIKTFKSEAMLKGASTFENRESLSMVMIDFHYDGEVFCLDKTFYANEIEKNGWELRLPIESLKEQAMIIYLDIYGNEYREIKKKEDFKIKRPSQKKEKRGEMNG